MTTERNQVRIIGGQWRGRPLRFPAQTAIRPSPNRVRETLFNWLQTVIAGRRCLDLFAGSGALGLEALSRGAAAVVFVDNDRVVVDHLQQTLKLFGAANGSVKFSDAQHFLAGTPSLYDVVFLDPPFAEDTVLLKICDRLENGGWLASPAFIYLETPAGAGEPRLPLNWTLLKSKRAGEVGYHLARRKVG